LLLGAGLALALGAAAAAPLLLPTSQYLPQTLRAARLRETRAAPAPERSPRSLGDDSLAAPLLPVAAPNAYGNSRVLDSWGRRNTNEAASGFAGPAILLLALLALAARRRFPQEGVMLAAAGLALLLLGLSPGVAPLRLALIVNFALAYVGACTLERW